MWIWNIALAGGLEGPLRCGEDAACVADWARRKSETRRRSGDVFGLGGLGLAAVSAAVAASGLRTNGHRQDRVVYAGLGFGGGLIGGLVARNAFKRKARAYEELERRARLQPHALLSPMTWSDLLDSDRVDPTLPEAAIVEEHPPWSCQIHSTESVFDVRCTR